MDPTDYTGYFEPNYASSDVPRSIESYDLVADGGEVDSERPEAAETSNEQVMKYLGAALTVTGGGLYFTDAVNVIGNASGESIALPFMIIGIGTYSWSSIKESLGD